MKEVIAAGKERRIFLVSVIQSEWTPMIHLYLQLLSTFTSYFLFLALFDKDMSWLGIY